MPTKDIFEINPGDPKLYTINYAFWVKIVLLYGRLLPHLGTGGG